MGATKRLAELAVLAVGDPRMRPMIVRFGNVLASSGSFVEVMRDRIREGEPLLLTNPDATRFFMAVSEAASLVMKASLIAAGGETFWLDMGPQVRIGDLAERLMMAAAAQGIPSVPVNVIGLRPGEKLHEQLASQGISMDQTTDPRIWVARQSLMTSARCAISIRALRNGVGRDDALAVLRALTAAVPDFVPSALAWTVARVPEVPRAVASRPGRRQLEPQHRRAHAPAKIVARR
jgi:FlaA1/EpsC-like NDP-sugar epimerase